VDVPAEITDFFFSRTGSDMIKRMRILNSLLDLPFFSLSKKKKFPVHKIFSNGPETSDGNVAASRDPQGTRKLREKKLYYYGLMFAAKEFVIKLHN
jgi:hypothetical protein